MAATWPAPTGVTWEDWLASPTRSSRDRHPGLAAFGHAAGDTADDDGSADCCQPPLPRKPPRAHDYCPRSRHYLSTLDGALAHSGALSPARLEHCRSVAR